MNAIMYEPDSLQRFLFEHANIRGEIVHLDATYQTILAQRPYPEGIKKLLGEALVSCILLTASIKFEGEVSLQFQGDERLPLLIVQCDDHLNVRAFATYKIKEVQEIDYQQAFLSGKMMLTINPHQQTQAYQSIVPINSDSMSDNLMNYFAQSEQLPTRVWLATNDSQAAGMLLQLMPGQDTLQREQFWEYAIQLGQTITEQELLTLDNRTILHRLYHETELRLFPTRSIRFHCRCTKEKMMQVLTILGEKDLKQLLEERGEVTIKCDFCNQSYSFDVIDITLLFRK